MKLWRWLWVMTFAMPLGLAQAGDDRNLPAEAPPRVALVVGNAAYPGAAALKNPANDATDFAAKLRKLGFDVTLRTDMRHKDMLRAFTEFGDKVQQGAEALFFFAGHGMQVRGKNYLIPVDAEIRTESAVSSEAVDVDQLLDKLASARLSMVILDACRNNPFERRFRGGGQGLASINAPTGTLIAYATAPGRVAADGEGRNGLYTQELLAAMDIPGIKVEDVFKRVRAAVIRKSGDAQTPWESSSLTGDFYFLPQGVHVSQVPQQVAALVPSMIGVRTPQQIEDELWDAIKSSDKPSVFEEYLKQYPKGRYIAQARVRLTALKDAVAPRQPAAAAADPETAFWNEVKVDGSREYLDAYLKQYPRGRYVALARVELQKLDEKEKAERTRQDAERAALAAREKQAAVKFERDAKQAEAEASYRVETDHWQRASGARDSATVQGYLDRYPAGRYAVEARTKLEAVKKEEAELKPGKVFRDCDDCPEMVVIPAGSFQMGSTGGDTEQPVHLVTLKAYAMGKTEVTQAQWQAVMGSNPSGFGGCGGSCPVERVNWYEAKEFANKLSAKTGKSYRLPSEAEWEYACRSGGDHEYCGGNNLDELGWYFIFFGGPKPVAQKNPNSWGLYDMSGNVQEWVEDCWNKSYYGAPGDGSLWASGDCTARPVRGGSWDALASDARSTKRKPGAPSFRAFYLGFRVVRGIP